MDGIQSYPTPKPVALPKLRNPIFDFSNDVCVKWQQMEIEIGL